MTPIFFVVMSSALHFDEDTSRLELMTHGHSLDSILQAMAEISQCLSTSNDLNAVMLNEKEFFSQLHEVFSRCRVERNTEGLAILCDTVYDVMNSMEGKKKVKYITSLLSDVIQCLTYPQVKDSSENLLRNISSNDPELSQHLTMEIERVLLNSNDPDIIDAVQSVASSILGNSITSLVGASRGKRESYKKQSNGLSIKTTGLDEPNNINSDKTPTSTKGGKSKTNLSSPRSMADAAGGGGYSRSGGGASGGTPKPKMLKVSFLPHSITEQWLLAQVCE